MKHLATILAALVLCHCGPTDLVPQEKELPPLNPARDFGGARGEPSHNDIARFLAGRPVRAGAELSSFQGRSDDYHLHALELDHLWRTRGAVRTLRQAQYFDMDLRPLLGSPSTVIYPFGGPDILYVSSILPRASTYILIGLEPAGYVPAVPGDQTIARLAALRGVMDKPLRYGYYLTKEMKNAPDVTTIMLTSLALAGAEVRDVRSTSVAGKPATEIRFTSPFGGEKTALYVSADLSNRGFGAIRPWLDSHAGATAYFKAASYLPHDSAFSGIRDWVLGNCRSVLQDDSGIPFRHYDPAGWDATLLGTYRRPIPLFAEWRQDDLAAAYAAAPATRVPFGSGYHAHPSEANFQVYRRR
jgi:hypothetical protein